MNRKKRLEQVQKIAQQAEENANAINDLIRDSQMNNDNNNVGETFANQRLKEIFDELVIPGLDDVDL